MCYPQTLRWFCLQLPVSVFLFKRIEFIFSIIEYSLSILFYFFNFQVARGAGHKEEGEKESSGYLSYLKSYSGFDATTRETLQWFRFMLQCSAKLDAWEWLSANEDCQRNKRKVQSSLGNCPLQILTQFENEYFSKDKSWLVKLCNILKLELYYKNLKDNYFRALSALETLIQPFMF